jgi:ribose 5-phosphate isomerase A
MTTDDQKRVAAEYAASLVESGMLVGLGSGSTAAFAITALAARVEAGLEITCIPTSERTAALALSHGLPLVDFTYPIDIDIDGADLIERRTLTLVKGLGGALFREKIVAAASRRMVVIADRSKLVERLGPGIAIPVEIAAFGQETVLARLTQAGVRPVLRRNGGTPFVTDGGNFIADCTVATPFDAPSLDARLKAITGVIETGLFVGLASEAVIGHEDRVEVIQR